MKFPILAAAVAMLAGCSTIPPVSPETALDHDNALQLLVATILSAQCTDKRVNLVTPALFARYQSAKDFAEAERDELENRRELLLAAMGTLNERERHILTERRLKDEPVTLEERGQFLLDYLELLLNERVNEANGFRHMAPGHEDRTAPARGREKWVINKLRALNSWYTKGLTGGSQLRVAINSTETIDQLRSVILDFFVINPKTVDVDDHRPVAMLPK